jgi:hypothetical protein
LSFRPHFSQTGRFMPGFSGLGFIGPLPAQRVAGLLDCRGHLFRQPSFNFARIVVAPTLQRFPRIDHGVKRGGERIT